MENDLTLKKIEELKESIRRRNHVFSDKKYYLDALFLPSTVVGREKEAEKLLSGIYSLKQGFVVPVISVYGRSGAGKSAVTRFVCQSLEGDVHHVFVNLRKAKTVFGCAKMILHALSPNAKNLNGSSLNHLLEKIESTIQCITTGTGHDSGGQGNNDDSHSFDNGVRISDDGNNSDGKYTISDHSRSFLLVLDEYDSIFSDRRGDPSGFMYKLLVMQENLRERYGVSFCIITISNESLVQNSALDDRVKSRMGNCEVFFPPYSEDAIFSILRDRAQTAFVYPPDDSTIQYCAKLSCSDHGDARRALELLRLAGEAACLRRDDTKQRDKQKTDPLKVSKEDVESATNLLYEDRIKQVLSSASYHQRMVVCAICLNHLYSEGEWTSTSKVYYKYVNILENDSESLSYNRVFELLVEIENAGLITSRRLSRGKLGYGSEYRLQYPLDMVAVAANGADWWERELWEKRSRESQLELEKQIRLGKAPADPYKSLRESNDITKRIEHLKNRFGYH